MLGETGNPNSRRSVHRPTRRRPLLLPRCAAGRTGQIHRDPDACSKSSAATPTSATRSKTMCSSSETLKCAPASPACAWTTRAAKPTSAGTRFPVIATGSAVRRTSSTGTTSIPTADPKDSPPSSECPAPSPAMPPRKCASSPLKPIPAPVPFNTFGNVSRDTTNQPLLFSKRTAFAVLFLFVFAD